MKILTYKYSDPFNEGWDFEQITLRSTNLLVGKSGSGKTRLLNSLFNIGTFIASSSNSFDGVWEIELEIGQAKYFWKFEGKKDPDSPSQTVVTHEEIFRIEKGDNVQLIMRNERLFTFNGQPLPKLSRTLSAISILKEEEDLKPLYEGFCGMMRRNFSTDELRNAVSISPISKDLGDELKANRSLELLNQSDLRLNSKLYLLDKYFPQLMESIFLRFKSVFPTFERFRIIDITKARELNLKVEFMAGFAPVFILHEKLVTKPLALHDLSAGILKVLLILVDVITLPDGYIYILDEYENSLGVNAIDFLPSLLIDRSDKIQFLVTSHHPYLINNLPIDDWIVFHRIGSTLHFKQGVDLKEVYGSSKQEKFIQLMNDPFYSED